MRQKISGYHLLGEAFLLMGMVLFLQESMPSLPGFSLLGGSAVLVWMLDWLMKGKWGKWILPAGLFAGLAAAMVFLPSLRAGLLWLMNSISHDYMQTTGRLVLAYEGADERGCLGFALLVLWIIALITAWSVKKKRAFGLLLLGAVLILGWGSGYLTSSGGIIFCSAGYLLLLWGRKQKNRRALVVQGAGMGIFALLAFALMTGISWDASAFRQFLQESIHQKRYHQASLALPEGKLANLGALEIEEGVSLIVEGETTQEIYLRGMVGDVYTGTAWEGLPSSTLAEYASLFYWIHDAGFFAQSALGNLGAQLGEGEESTLTVTICGACSSLLYTPYGLLGNDLLDERILDDSLIPAGDLTVTFSYISGSSSVWTSWQSIVAGQSEEWEEYLIAEQAYREFVYDNYLEIPETAENTLASLIGEEKNTEHTLAEIKVLITAFLEKNLVYEEEVITYSGDSDFVTYTLEQSGEGYSVHYATIATLLLRYYGVPARYVEGYYLPDGVPEGELWVDESYAHAWTEYYLDGVGWIPLETTSGYVSYADLLEGTVSTIQEETEETLQDEGTSTLQQDESQELNREDGENISWKKILLAQFLFLYLLLQLLLVRCRCRLKRKQRAMEKEEPREAIASYFGYATALAEAAGIELTDPQMKLLNQEALFSTHTMSEKQKELLRQYAWNIRRECHKAWNIRQRLYYRWLRALY